MTCLYIKLFQTCYDILKIEKEKKLFRDEFELSEIISFIIDCSA